MRKNIIYGRYTALTDKPYVVFLVGMRINQLWAIHRWVPVFMAMTRMMIELRKDASSGVLSAQTRFSWREIMVQSYWRSYDELERYARAVNTEHLSAWERFNKKVSAGGVVGIWHETYLIDPDHYENIYVNMPVSGFAKSKTSDFIIATGKNETSRKRLGGHNDVAVKSPEPSQNQSAKG
ncbi:MAG: DUF4188 domain-containing protein [Gammaproteobacteria bacterium]|nr:DUF4188 domain-containing protein [Gammaproteobacteria bacterium]